MSGSWWQRAQCRDHGIDDWFAKPRSRDAAKAQLLCGYCPVVADCLAEAMRAEDGAAEAMRFGIFGNTTPAQRAALADDSVHGTTRAPAHCECTPCNDLRRGTRARNRLVTIQRRTPASRTKPSTQNRKTP